MKTIAALALVLLLAGCTPTPTPAEDDDSSGGEVLDGGSTACVIDHDWQLDVQDAAQQLGTQLASSGMSVVSSTGEGSQGLWFDQEGIVGSATSVSYTMVIDMGDGLTMTMVQHHEGSPGGSWAWDGEDESTIVFDGWTGDYVVTTDTSINGMAAPTSTAPLGSGLDGQSMTVSCEGDTLTTQAAGSPFTHTWH